MRTLWTMVIVMAFALLAWAIQERLPFIAAAGRIWGRIWRSTAFMNTLVLICVMLPIDGVVTAFWTGDWRWLVLLFFLCPFFA